MQIAALAGSLALLAACQPASDPSDGAPTSGTRGTASPAAAPPNAATGRAPTVGIPEVGIPVALQGNWGMVSGDCTSTRGDAKGLLRVSATTLTFYESVGRLGTIEERTDTSIRADYAFTGEGMEWTREIELAVSGNTLIRRDRAEDTQGSFTYTKCAG